MVGVNLKKLQLTIHDVSPVHEDTLRKIHSTLCELGAVRYSMLVVPDYHGEWPLEEYPDFCRWLKELQESGVEMVLHGLLHKGTTALGAADRIRSSFFTRGEGEFLGLDEKKAEQLLREGRETLKRALGSEVNGFVAPAWLYSSGTIAALAKAGFTFAENRRHVWDPRTGRNILRIPVVNYAGGSYVKRSLAAFWVSVSGNLQSGSETVRFAIHPCDFESDGMKNRVRKRLKTLLRRRKTISFTDLLPVP